MNKKDKIEEQRRIAEELCSLPLSERIELMRSMVPEGKEIDVSAMENAPESKLPILASVQGIVPVYDLNGNLCMSAEDLGKALGYSDPIGSMEQLYDKHKDELNPWRFSYRNNRNTSGGRPRIFYTEMGITMVCMFARTPIAKEAGIQIAFMVQQFRQQQRTALLEEKINLLIRYNALLESKIKKRPLMITEEKEQAFAYHTQGLGILDIARKLRRSQGTISDLIKYGATHSKRANE